jgi:transglutaminase-like putative cysteine protease
LVYSIRHITSFAYEPAIRESVMEVRVQPRNEARQRCLTFSLEVSPNANIMTYRDFLGNTVHHFDIPGRHTQFKVTAQALVDIQALPMPSPAQVGTWADLDSIIAGGDFSEMLLPSQFTQSTELLQALIGELHVERSGNPLERMLELNHAIYHAFEYVPNVTKVDSPIDDALRDRKGVCQDLTHIMIAIVRQLGVPCRYVSGYLCQREGAHDRSADGATHAWLEAFLPGPGWVAFDPTNDLVEGERHIRVAIGRDYADVPPTRGVYKGDAESELGVAVLVAPAEAPAPEEIIPTTIIRTRAPNRGGLEQFQYEQQQQ